MSKSSLRNTAKAVRAACAAALPDFADQIAAYDLALPPGVCVAGYAAIRDEADPAALMRALALQCHPLSLPRVVAPHEPLSFHVWHGEALQAGAYGILEPLAQAPKAEPAVLLVPLLAFDAGGHRLGYGGGYYDRSLAAMRAQRPVRAIGIAYAGQEMAEIERGPYDQRLDAVLTETGLRQFPD